MIQSFAESETELLFRTGKSRRWANIASVAKRKLRQMEFAERLDDLRIPPKNHLELLRGDRKGQHSIRIDGQWRICFVWKTDGAHEVEIVDYH